MNIAQVAHLLSAFVYNDVGEAPGRREGKIGRAEGPIYGQF